jgi:hypothetical protein
MFASLLVHGAGCSVPPSRLGKSVREIRSKLAEMEEAASGERWEIALTRAKEIAELGNALSSKVLIGDPLRKTVDEALAKAREVREKVRRQNARSTLAARRQLESMAKDVLKKTAANKKKPSAPPENAASLTLLASVPGSAPARAAVADVGPAAPRGAGGEVDLDRHTTIVQGDKAGDIADDEVVVRKRKEKQAKDLAPKKLKIDGSTPPLVISQKPITQGKGVVAYFTVVNNTIDPQYVVAAYTVFLRETGAKSGSTTTTFKVEGFVPNWDDILASKGETLTGDGIAIEPMSGLQLVAVGMKPKVGKIEKVKLEVRMRGDKVHRAKGPTNPVEDKD